MKTEYEIAATLKRMMATIPLSEITVMEITKRCHVNRQTFYYHYHDVFDVLTVIFLTEKIENIDKANSLAVMIHDIYNYYTKNAEFIDASLNSAGRDLVKEFFYNNCYQTILRFIIKYDNENVININNRKAIARFYASAFSNSIIYYLINFQKKTLAGLMKTFAFVSEDTIIEAIRKTVHNQDLDK